MRYLILSLFWLVGASQGLSQAAWELGFQVGAAGYLGDLSPNSLPETDQLGLTVGTRLGVNFDNRWLLRFDLDRTLLRGTDQSFTDPVFRNQRRYSFTATLYGAAAQLVWEPLGQNRYPFEGGYNNIVSPYVFVGVGVLYTDTRPDFSRTTDGTTPGIVADLSRENPQLQWQIPFGGGLRFDLNKRNNIGIELSLHKGLTDYLDGISQAANPVSKDWYTVGRLTYTLRFSRKDYDRDGIADIDDDCPRLAGVRSANGCPDADRDGVEDIEDVCPDIYGPRLTNGCPDLDFDGVNDTEDPCLYQPGTIASGGCPDRDGDGLADRDDLCPGCAGDPANAGCPDRDGDGVIDLRDKCPGIAGDVTLDGCPTEEEAVRVVQALEERRSAFLALVNELKMNDLAASIPESKDEAPEPAQPSESIPSIADTPPVALTTPTEAEEAVERPTPMDVPISATPPAITDGEAPETIDRSTDADDLPISATPLAITDDEPPAKVAPSTAPTDLPISATPLAIARDDRPDAKNNTPGETDTIKTDTPATPTRPAEESTEDLIVILTEKGEMPAAAEDDILSPLEELPGEVMVALDLATESVQFDFAKANILPVGQTILQDLARVLQRYPDFHLRIEGHTDSKGSLVLNQRLSERRASAAYAYLRAQGIAAERMSYRGYGETRPVDSNANELGRARNRRVNFVLYEKE